ncbi:hypothetical protein CHELA1G11_20798 [Hyphomicrobiales bacterium]|nr:hypothetical protein CHELA1G11_20798 [Hyphomicrobiales bacterium]CAH1691989.1 hypothetical protein CHELA1G2_21113 [Hyphomicrobiales bacterium]
MKLKTLRVLPLVACCEAFRVAPLMTASSQLEVARGCSAPGLDNLVERVEPIWRFWIFLPVTRQR